LHSEFIISADRLIVDAKTKSRKNIFSALFLIVFFIELNLVKGYYLFSS